MKTFSLLVSLALHLGFVYAGVEKGVIKGDDSWVFLSRFAFNSPRTQKTSKGVTTLGRVKAEFTYPTTSHPVLMLYYLKAKDTTIGSAKPGFNDEWGQWQEIYQDGKSTTSCSEKYTMASKNGYAFPMDQMTQVGKLRSTVRNGQEVTLKTVKLDKGFSTSRTRWFFVTVGDCPLACTDGVSYCSRGVDVTYTLNFTNGDGFDHYFTADEQDIPEIQISFVVLYFILLTMTMIVRFRLQKQRKYHHTVKLLVFSVWCTFLNNFFMMIYKINYARYGVKSQLMGFNIMGVIFEGFADQAMVLQLILLGKGWTIVRRKISGQGRMRMAVYLTIYIITYWACLIYYQYGVDPAAIEYIFSTPPGRVLVALRVLTFVWFSYAIYTTLKKYRAKRGFYRKLWFLGALWILWLPASVAINESIVPYVRARVVFGMSSFFNFAFLCLMVAIYNPQGMFASTFPFHATTTEMMNANVGKGHGRGAGIGANSFEELHLRRATEISRRIRQGVTLLQSYSADLNSFLEEIDPTTELLETQDEELVSKRGQHSRAAMQPSVSFKPGGNVKFNSGSTGWQPPSDAVPTSPRSKNSTGAGGSPAAAAGGPNVDGDNSDDEDDKRIAYSGRTVGLS